MLIRVLDGKPTPSQGPRYAVTEEWHEDEDLVLARGLEGEPSNLRPTHTLDLAESEVHGFETKWGPAVAGLYADLVCRHGQPGKRPGDLSFAGAVASQYVV